MEESFPIEEEEPPPPAPDGDPEGEDDAEPMTDPGYKDLMTELRAKFDHVLLRKISKLHDQFGHPSAKALAKELTKRKCPKELILCAGVYTCPTCFAVSKPALSRVAALPTAQFFNHVVDSDNFVVKWAQRNRRIQSIMDEATRFEADVRLRRETAAE